MKIVFLLLSLLSTALAHGQSVQPPTLSARAWLLVDHASGQSLVEHEADARVEPASLTKLMTAYLTFAALKQGTLKLDQAVAVSERAWKAPGSRMFIDPKRAVTVDELIQGMIVQSGNDACVALAEAIAGGEASFAPMMNRESRRLGLANTLYVNATGLPDPGHYSTARDLAGLAQAIIRDFPERYATYSRKDYTYNRITQPNRNRLLWLDPTVDGVKTGFTENDGYCLIASSKRGARRLISVVLGADSDGMRAPESRRLLNHGFLNFDAVRVHEKDQAVSRLKVFKGAQGTVKVGFQEDFVLSLPKGMAERLKMELVSRQPLLAPVQPGQAIATLKLSADGKPLGEYPVVALEHIPVAGMFGRAWDTLMLWFK